MLPAIALVSALSGACATGPGAQGAPQAVERRADTVSAALLAEAARLRAADPADWARLEGEVQRVLDEHARRTADWRYQRPPPRPDLRAAELPAAFLMARFEALRGDRANRQLALSCATALIAAEDPRGLDAVLEAHDQSADAPYGLVRAIAASLPAARTAPVILAQVGRMRPVERGALALELLEVVRARSPRGALALPAEVADAARAWLATFPGGPSNGLGDAVWRLRLRLGGAADRDALVPFVLDEDDLLYDLRAVLDAPRPHGGLAAALRAREARLTEHERSFLRPFMRRALLVSAPAEELAGYLARLDRQLAEVDWADVTDGALQECLLDAYVLVDVAHPAARAARKGIVRDTRLSWSARRHLVAEARSAGREDADELRAWFAAHAPQREVEALEQDVERSSTPIERPH